MKHSNDFSHPNVVPVPKAFGPPPVLAPWVPLTTNQSGASKAIAAVVALLAVSLVADAALRDFAMQIDPTVKAVLRQITQMGNSAWPLGIGGLLWLTLAALLRHRSGPARTALRRAQASLLFVMISVALSGALANLLKQVIGRARPMTEGGAGVFQFKLMAFDPAWASFPSGHATTAMAMMVALAMILPRHALACVAIGLLGASSRVLLGVHWVSDVAAGAALGVGVTIALRPRFDTGRTRALMPPGATRLLRRCVGDLAQIKLQRLLKAIRHKLNKCRPTNGQ